MRALLLVICLTWAAAAMPVKAQTVKPGIDAMLVLDNSGSMRKNDPRRLLKSVVRDFARRLDPGDRLGVVIFDESARKLMELTPVSDTGFDTALEAALAKLTYGGHLTDIPRGLELARYELDRAAGNQLTQILVLLTDGQVDLGSPVGNAEAKRYLRATVIPDIKGLGAHVFGITLSDDADISLIQEIAQATGGSYFKLLQATDIPLPFDRISARLNTLRDPPADQERSAGVVQKVIAAQLQQLEAERQQLAELLAQASQEAEQRRQEIIDQAAQAARDAEQRYENERRSEAAVALPKKQDQIVDSQTRSTGRWVLPTQWVTAGSAILLLLLGAVMTYSVFTILHPLSKRNPLSTTRG
jgi:Mg-chelatase subunit ChlD